MAGPTSETTGSEGWRPVVPRTGFDGRFQTLGRVLQPSIEALKAEPGVLIGASALAVLVPMVLAVAGMVAFLMLASSSTLLVATLAVVAITLPSTPLFLWGRGLVVLLGFEAAAGRRPSFGGAARYALSRTRPLLLAAMAPFLGPALVLMPLHLGAMWALSRDMGLVGLVLVLVEFPLVFVAMYLALRLLPAADLVLLEPGCSAKDALRRAWAATRGTRVLVMLAGTMLGNVIGQLGMVLCGVGYVASYPVGALVRAFTAVGLLEAEAGAANQGGSPVEAAAAPGPGLPPG